MPKKSRRDAGAPGQSTEFETSSGKPRPGMQVCAITYDAVYKISILSAEPLDAVCVHGGIIPEGGRVEEQRPDDLIW